MSQAISYICRVISRNKKLMAQNEQINKKVCMLVWNYFQTDARVTNEAITVGKEGKDVLVIALSDHKTTPEFEDRGDFKVRRVSRNSLGWVRAVTTIRLIMTAISEKAGIYHSNDLNTTIPGYIASRFWGTRLIYDAHEVSTDRMGWKCKNLYYLLEKFMIRRADVVITTNETRANFFKETYKIKMPIILKNAPRFQSVKSDNRIRNKLGIPEETKIILYQGGLQPERGLENLVKSVSYIKNVVLVFIGYGKLEELLKMLVKKEGIEHKVFFLGMIPNEELLKWTASADVGMQVLQNTCFNHYSSISNKIHEYIMAGIPMVASDLPEMKKIVEGYNVGVTVDPDDPKSISRGIRLLIQDQAKYNEFKQNCYKASRILNWENEEDKLRDIYSQSLGG